MSAKTHLQHPTGAKKPRTFTGYLYFTICGRWVCDDLVVGAEQDPLVDCRQCLAKMVKP